MILIDLCQKASTKVNHFLDLELPDPVYNETKLKVLETYRVLEEAFEKFNLHEISVSYNGGKDCLVMLVILLAVLYDKHRHLLLAADIGAKLNAIFINTELSFPEMDQFLQQSIEEYQLSFIELNDTLRNGFESYLKLKPQIKLIVVGMRRIDPYGGDLDFFEKTDHHWPDFMRIHPVLNWEYVDVWYFLTKNDIQYCKLYDQGYTSIGGIHNTVPNPCLLKEGTSDEYYPAWHLKENDKERLSRI